MTQIKDNLFSIHGVITSVIHLTLVAGALALYIGFRVKVMGQDVSLSTPDYGMYDAPVKKK